jgi:hypothetical protein
MTAYRLTTLPVTSMPWPSKTAFAISRPIVVLVCITGSSESWEPWQTHIHGTHVPVEEPSTASKADITALLNQLVSAGESRQ